MYKRQDEKGEPMIGVNIRIPGTGTGTLFLLNLDYSNYLYNDKMLTISIYGIMAEDYNFDGWFELEG